ncbi:hypothetical protein [Seongchinamella unica]|uniref:hypothetical protein n=1 Tax=Seongchinamella unica TaxID=2547392 RepID=UPI0023B177E7|nr:hypothetical protein [Seongchinamella unica]
MGFGHGEARVFHEGDMARACQRAMDLSLDRYQEITEPRLSHLNVRSYADFTMAELAKMIRETAGFEGRIEFDTGKPDGALRKLLDIYELGRLEWKPAICLRNGLAETYDWFTEDL